ncbi:glycine dehydrogenase (decarboxylating) [gamma proteobacterium HTCC5015]|nr:glycine dehydrogenase (decarboxylating) [gamma proteobacterium HTCC5015]
MPFIPHTPSEIDQMLGAIGVDSIDQLFDEIPEALRIGELSAIPESMDEMEVSRLMQGRARRDGGALNFIGAGAYEHHIPAAVWQITTRGEFYSAYTPYQAEASQGTLQLIYEYQTMMAGLTAMDVSNASLYDGASALAEAILMAVRGNRKSKSRKVLVPGGVHPYYRDTAYAIVKNQNIELVEVPYSEVSGASELSAFDAYAGEDITAVVIQQPNFFGQFEAVDAITDWAHNNGSLVIGVCNPLALTLITPPGEWGQNGADIACGDGQPLGAPLSSGGPYYGYMCCTQKLVRQMPGRIVGRTVDLEGKQGFALTLQAREQHIRRSKATSNICTNQGLVVTASTIHMAIMGPKGLTRQAELSHANTQALADRVCQIDGVERVFEGASFHEVALRLPKPVAEVIDAMEDQGILAGYDLTQRYSELGDALLLCATETKTDDDLEQYAQALEQALA